MTLISKVADFIFPDTTLPRVSPPATTPFPLPRQLPREYVQPPHMLPPISHVLKISIYLEILPMPPSHKSRVPAERGFDHFPSMRRIQQAPPSYEADSHSPNAGEEPDTKVIHRDDERTPTTVISQNKIPTGRIIPPSHTVG